MNNTTYIKKTKNKYFLSNQNFKMSSKKLLLNQLVQMKKNPVWGICCEMPDESDVFTWDVYLEGPSDTPYENGIFKLQFKFPEEYFTLKSIFFLFFSIVIHFHRHL